MLDTQALPHYFNAEHADYRAALRDFVAREITPFVNEWDEAETFPRDLYQRIARLGVLGIGYPEALGGTPADIFYHLITAEEMARSAMHGAALSVGVDHPNYTTQRQLADDERNALVSDLA